MAERPLQYVAHERVDDAVFLTVRYRALGFLWWRRLTYVRLPGKDYWFLPERAADYGNTRELSNLLDLAEIRERQYERLLADEPARNGDKAR